MNLTDVQQLVFELTSHCNLKCPQCSRTDEDGNLPSYVTLQHLNVDLVLDNLELDKLTNLKIIGFEGDTGDALMHPKLDKILDVFYNLPVSPSILVVTNGSLRSTDWWYNLGKRFSSPRFAVQFSIDGLSDTNNLYRVGSLYEKAVDNAKAFIAGGGLAIQRCLVFKHNEHQLDEIQEVAKNIGFHILIFRHGDHDRFKSLDRWNVFVNGQLSHSIEPSSIPLEGYGYGLSSLRVPTLDHNINETCLAFKKGQVSITYQGHIIPCCVYNADLYFNGEGSQGFKDLINNVDNISIEKNTLTHIISNTYFDKLNNMLDNNIHPGKCHLLCPTLGLSSPQQVIPIIPI